MTDFAHRKLFYGSSISPAARPAFAGLRRLFRFCHTWVWIWLKTPLCPEYNVPLVGESTDTQAGRPPSTTEGQDIRTIVGRCIWTHKRLNKHGWEAR